MEEVRAYKDISGEIHLTENSCKKADIEIELRKIIDETLELGWEDIDSLLYTIQEIHKIGKEVLIRRFINQLDHEREEKCQK